MKSRREFLTLSSIASLWLLSGGSLSADNTVDNTQNSVSGSRSLPIPPLLEGSMIEGVRHYNIDIDAGSHEFFDGIQTTTWGMNGSYLGPTILLNNGEEVSINYTNNLPDPTTMHGHGMHLPGEMDGTAHQPFNPGETWSAQYTVNQKACTNWYHPHYLHNTAPQVYKGLAGIIIIQDDESTVLDIPKRYGIDDIPLVLQDRAFTSDKSEFDYPPTVLSNNYLVCNGAIEPVFNAQAKELRLRLLNGSNFSMYELEFVDQREFIQIASDNAFLERPVTMSKIKLSPGERAEIVIDLTSDKGASLELWELNKSNRFLTINVNTDADAFTYTPDHLTTLEPVGTPTRKRRFQLTGGDTAQFGINGKSMDMNRIDARMVLGEVEEWEIVNRSGMNHNFHIHGTHFRLISRKTEPVFGDGIPIPIADNEKGYKDVVHLPPYRSVKFIVKMTDVTADDNNPYMFHCHFLEHEDNGMMGQFTVSKPTTITPIINYLLS